MSTLTDLKTGAIVKVNDEPYLITSNTFMKKDMGKPVMQTVLKNCITGKTMNKNFGAGEKFELADIERRQSQFLYADNEAGHFMDNETFEQLALPLDQIEGILKFLKEDTEVYITYFEGRAIGVQPPVKITLKVIETPPGVKGDTATGGTKPATLETGVVVNVPLFINEGDMLIVNTDTGEYVSRASE